jgi:AraC-like DNA-binding protein
LQKGTVELIWENGRRLVEADHWIVPTPLRRTERFSADAEVRSLRFNAFSADGRMLLCPAEPFVLPGHKAAALGRHLGRLRAFLRDELEMDLGMKSLLSEAPMTLRHRVEMRERIASWFGALLDAVEAQGGIDSADLTHHPAVIAALHDLAGRDLRHPLREAAVARSAGISLSHLRRLFRQQVGFTLKSWDGKRLEDATKQALRSGRLSCKEIAHAHGFSSASHFSRWFKETQEVTPSEWLALKTPDDVV